MIVLIIGYICHKIVIRSLHLAIVNSSHGLLCDFQSEPIDCAPSGISKAEIRDKHFE